MAARYTVTIYHNPRCTTSRKTLELLRDNGIEPTVVQYLKTPPSRAELVKMIKDAGIDVRTAVRKRESLYAELNLADASDDELLDAMAAQSDPHRAAVRRHAERHPAGPADRRGSRDSVSLRLRMRAPSRWWLFAATGCGAKAPDYQSVWSTSTDDHHPTSTEPPVPLAAYLEQRGRRPASSVAPDKLTDLTVTMPTPPGWQPVREPEFGAGHPRHRQGRHLPDRNAVGVQADRRLRRQRGHQARLCRRGAVAELQAPQRIDGQLARAFRRR